MLTIAQRIDRIKFGLKEVSINEVIETIRTGDMILYDPAVGSYTLKDATLAIRSVTDSNKQNELKARLLPVATFNGVWDGVKISNYSNITALDFDHIYNDEQSRAVSTTLKSVPYVLAVFRTFKPYRLKALVMHDNPDLEKHKEMYEQLISIFGLYGIDESCKDISRKTYLPCDDEIWINPNCTAYNFVPTIPKPVPFNNQGVFVRKSGRQKSPQSIINILDSSWHKKHPEYWEHGYRANSIFRCACQFCEYGVPQDMAEDYFMSGGWMANDFTEEEIRKHIKGAYHYIKDKFGSKDFI